jgi:hypothetical protein
MNFKWGGRAEEVGLDFTRQLQEVHYLSDTRPRDTLTRSNAGLGQAGIPCHLLTPSGAPAWTTRRKAKTKVASTPRHLLPVLSGDRKGLGRRGILPLNEAITSGRAAATDYEGLLSDVLDELLEMDGRYWLEKTERLKELLRP